MRIEDTLVAAVVGIDGCGKSTTFRDALDALAASFPVAGVGELVLSGNPDESVRERSDIPLTGSARLVGRLAKGRNLPTLYKDLKFLEFIERTRIPRLHRCAGAADRSPHRRRSLGEHCLVGGRALLPRGTVGWR